MSCGKRPFVKLWDKPRSIRVIKASRYQQNEACVKLHWKNVVKDLEAYYGDDKFWESQSSTVRELVGPVIYERLAKIFNLPLKERPCSPPHEPLNVYSSEQFYEKKTTIFSSQKIELKASFMDTESMQEEQQEEEVQSDQSVASTESTVVPLAEPRSVSSVESGILLRPSFKSYSKIMSKVYSRTFGEQFVRSFSAKFEHEALSKSIESTKGSTANSDDDIIVQPKSISTRLRYRRLRKSAGGRGKVYNPHFDMLFCNDSVTDMVKWNSRMFKRRTFDLSASDEYSKKAELLTKQIAYEFYDWWTAIGSPEYKSEIKRPLDITDLFQVWFDEHASRGLMLDPKILPCVLQSVANNVNTPKASCPTALKRQIAWDIHAETSPAVTTAFNAPLPLKMKHIPPKNNTAEAWHAVRIPEDLKSMSAVWGDIAHLTSSKTFKAWLQQRPTLPMPPCLKTLDAPGDKKQLFVTPSDFIVRDKNKQSISIHELTIPTSKFTIELKDVLSRILND